MQKPSEHIVPPLQDIASRDGVRGMVRELHKFLVNFVRLDYVCKTRLVQEINPLYGELDWTPVAIADGAQGTPIEIDVAGAIPGYTCAVSYDQDLQGLQMTSYVLTDKAVVILKNDTGGAVTLDAGRFRAYVLARQLTE